MASITKLVTMLVVLQAKPLAVARGTVRHDDVGRRRLYNRYLAQNGSISPVRSGLVFTQHELMELSLVKSADNYAASLAVWRTDRWMPTWRQRRPGSPRTSSRA